MTLERLLEQLRLELSAVAGLRVLESGVAIPAEYQVVVTVALAPVDVVIQQALIEMPVMKFFSHERLRDAAIQPVLIPGVTRRLRDKLATRHHTHLTLTEFLALYTSSSLQEGPHQLTWKHVSALSTVLLRHGFSLR
jgi:hypothetical protein